MSDIVIRNMDMPKSCSECMFCALGGLGKPPVVECDVLSEIDDIHDLSENYDKWYYRQVHHLCPLVELPELHGDLIDRDKLATTFEKYEVEETFVFDLLFDAPTVLEASED